MTVIRLSSMGTRQLLLAGIKHLCFFMAFLAVLPVLLVVAVIQRGESQPR